MVPAATPVVLHPGGSRAAMPSRWVRMGPQATMSGRGGQVWASGRAFARSQCLIVGSGWKSSGQRRILSFLTADGAGQAEQGRSEGQPAVHSAPRRLLATGLANVPGASAGGREFRPHDSPAASQAVCPPLHDPYPLCRQHPEVGGFGTPPRHRHIYTVFKGLSPARGTTRDPRRAGRTPAPCAVGS